MVMRESKPQWVQRQEWLESQPDLLKAAQAALPYLDGVLALTEKAELLDSWHDVQSDRDRLYGAICKEQHRRTGEDGELE